MTCSAANPAPGRVRVECDGAVGQHRLPKGTRHGSLVGFTALEPDFRDPVEEHSALGGLGSDRANDVVLHVAQEPRHGVEGETAVLLVPPAAGLLGIEVLVKLQEEHRLDHGHLVSEPDSALSRGAGQSLTSRETLDGSVPHLSGSIRRGLAGDGLSGYRVVFERQPRPVRSQAT